MFRMSTEPVSNYPHVDDAPEVQREILIHLMRNGTATSIELRRAAGLSPSGINHHLAIMLAQGLVERRTQRASSLGRGRPAFAYAIAPKGEGLFPARGFSFVVKVLGSLAERDPGLVDEVISRELQPLVADARKRIKGTGSLSDRLDELRQLFEEWGYITNTVVPAPYAGSFEQAHCPFASVASACPQVCALESSLLASALGGFDLRKVHSRASGSRTCRWSVRNLRPIGDPEDSTASLTTTCT